VPSVTLFPAALSGAVFPSWCGPAWTLLVFGHLSAKWPGDLLPLLVTHPPSVHWALTAMLGAGLDHGLGAQVRGQRGLGLRPCHLLGGLCRGTPEAKVASLDVTVLSLQGWTQWPPRAALGWSLLWSLAHFLGLLGDGDGGNGEVLMSPASLPPPPPVLSLFSVMASAMPTVAIKTYGPGVHTAPVLPFSPHHPHPRLMTWAEPQHQPPAASGRTGDSGDSGDSGDRQQGPDWTSLHLGPQLVTITVSCGHRREPGDEEAKLSHVGKRTDGGQGRGLDGWQKCPPPVTPSLWSPHQEPLRLLAGWRTRGLSQQAIFDLPPACGTRGLGLGSSCPPFPVSSLDLVIYLLVFYAALGFELRVPSTT
jgi:hypothetical protein